MQSPKQLSSQISTRIHHHRFNDSTALPLANSLMSLSNSLSNSCVLILPSNHCTPSPLNDPILTKAENPLAQISSPRCEALPNGKLLVKTITPSSPSWFSCVLVGTCQRFNSGVREYADGCPKQCSACTIFLRSQKLLASPAPETDCQKMLN